MDPGVEAADVLRDETLEEPDGLAVPTIVVQLDGVEDGVDVPLVGLDARDEPFEGGGEGLGLLGVAEHLLEQLVHQVANRSDGANGGCRRRADGLWWQSP